MVLWFNDAILNLKCKTKGNWEKAEFQNSHELFRKLGIVFWACSLFIHWEMKILFACFTGLILGLQERRFEPVYQFWRTNVTANQQKNMNWSVLFLVQIISG